MNAKMTFSAIVFIIGVSSCCALRLGDSSRGAVQEPQQLQDNTEENSKTLENGGGDHGFNQGSLQGLAMILVSELGDETFIIAAIMAMRHPKWTVFGAAIAALAAMTVISSALGVVVPALLSPEITRRAATLLYTIFGFRLLYIAWKANPEEAQEEIKEVEQKLSDPQKESSAVLQILQTIITPVFLEAFILTFLAEWGDRSQIATITLAAHLNPYGVALGAIVGHCACTGLAVTGGKLVARKISQRTAALAGSALFFAFAIHTVL